VSLLVLLVAMFPQLSAAGCCCAAGLSQPLFSRLVSCVAGALLSQVALLSCVAGAAGVVLLPLLFLGLLLALLRIASATLLGL
jgi:hypothetical protein